MEKDYQTRLAERNARIEARHAEAEKLEPVKWQVLKDAQPLPVGAERSAAVDKYLQIAEQQHQLKPDPAHLHNRRMEQRQDTREAANQHREQKALDDLAYAARFAGVKPDWSDPEFLGFVEEWNWNREQASSAKDWGKPAQTQQAAPASHKDWGKSAEQSRPLDIKPLPEQSQDRDR